MLQRTLPAGFIAPCLPTKAETLPSGGAWLHDPNTMQLLADEVIE